MSRVTALVSMLGAHGLAASRRQHVGIVGLPDAKSQQFLGLPDAVPAQFLDHECRRATVRARPLLGGFSRVPCAVCSMLVLTARRPASRSRRFQRMAATSALRRPQSANVEAALAS